MNKQAKIMTMLGLLVLCGAAWAVEPNLVSHWEFDETSGTTALDCVGDNNGTVHGAIWTTGQIDGALDFDGDDDYVEVAHHDSLNLLSEGTVAVWLKLNERGRRQGIVTKQPGINSGNYYFVVSPHVLGEVVFGVTNGTWSAKSEIYAPGDAPINEWTFYVGTFDDSSVCIYKNGVLVGSNPNTTTPIETTEPLIIGFWPYDSDSYLNGTIDEVAIYDQALSAEEVEQLYWAGFSDYERAIIRIENAIDKKQAVLETVDAALVEEEDAYDALEELLESGDYGDLKKGDIVQAMQKIHSAMQHQEQSIDTLEKSIEKLEDVLAALGWEPEPEPDLPEP